MVLLGEVWGSGHPMLVQTLWFQADLGPCHPHPALDLDLLVFLAFLHSGVVPAAVGLVQSLPVLVGVGASVGSEGVLPLLLLPIQLTWSTHQRLVGGACSAMGVVLVPLSGVVRCFNPPLHKINSFRLLLLLLLLPV